MSINNLNSFDVGIHGYYFNVELAKKQPMKEEINLSGMDRVEILMSEFEESLDYAGGIPGLNVPSSLIRFAYGTTQLITALAFKVIYCNWVGFVQ